MTNGAPSPKEVFMYLDIVVEFQKRVVSSMDGVANRLHDQSADLTRVTRALQQAREDQIDFRSEMGRRLDKVDARFAGIDARLTEIGARLEKAERENAGRFSAVGARFEEIEKGLEQLFRELHDARSEIVAQNNQTINAVHAGLTVQIKLDEILEHLAAIEDRLRGGDGAASDWP